VTHTGRQIGRVVESIKRSAVESEQVFVEIRYVMARTARVPPIARNVRS
jgi:hypothetical protein